MLEKLQGWWKYDVPMYLSRQRTDFWGWVGHRLPKRIRYWVVICTAVEVSWAQPTKEVPDITWYDMAQHLEK